MFILQIIAIIQTALLSPVVTEGDRVICQWRVSFTSAFIFGTYVTGHTELSK